MTSSRPTRSSDRTPDAVSAEELFSQAWVCLRTGQLDGLNSLCAPKFKFSMPGTVNIPLSRFKEIITMWRGAFADFGQRRGDLSLICSPNGRQMASRDSHTVTHSGPFQLPNGVYLEATGRTVMFVGSHWILADQGGILKWDFVLDRTSLTAQLEPNPYAPVYPHYQMPGSGAAQNTPRIVLDALPSGLPWAAFQ